VVQIENYYQGEKNPFNHVSQDTLAHMNIDYWLEQVKATVVNATRLLE
jgi:hypothetical protein